MNAGTDLAPNKGLIPSLKKKTDDNENGDKAARIINKKSVLDVSRPVLKLTMLGFRLGSQSCSQFRALMTLRTRNETSWKRQMWPIL